MEDVGKEGRTVIFVSHQMSTVEALCSRAIVLKEGSVYLDGSTREGIDTYLESGYQLANNIKLVDRKDRSGSGKIRATGFKILDINGIEVISPESGKDYCFELTCKNHLDRQISNVVISLDVYDERDQRVLLFRSNFSDSNLTISPGISKIKCCINQFPLSIGLYRISVFLSYADQETLDFVGDAASFAIDSGDFFGTGSSGMPSHCKILVNNSWAVSNAKVASELDVILN
jgi:lipopolysaccharide transport system ATP-binding protein